MELLPYVPITLFKHLQDLGRADSTVAAIQSDSAKVLPIDRLLADILLPVETQTLRAS